MWSVRVVNQWYYHSCATITCRTATSQKALWNHRNEFVNKIVIYSCKSNGSIWKKNCIGMKITVSMKYSQVSSSAQTTASSLTRLKSCWFYERRLYCTVTYIIYHIYISYSSTNCRQGYEYALGEETIRHLVPSTCDRLPSTGCTTLSEKESVHKYMESIQHKEERMRASKSIIV